MIIPIDLNYHNHRQIIAVNFHHYHRQSIAVNIPFIARFYQQCYHHRHCYIVIDLR